MTISTRINVKIITNSHKDEICGFLGDVIKIKIKSKPIHGKANMYLIKFLSKILSINQSDIFIVSGISSSKKTIEIINIEPMELFTKLGLDQEEP